MSVKRIPLAMMIHTVPLQDVIHVSQMLTVLGEIDFYQILAFGDIMIKPQQS